MNNLNDLNTNETSILREQISVILDSLKILDEKISKKKKLNEIRDNISELDNLYEGYLNDYSLLDLISKAVINLQGMIQEVYREIDIIQGDRVRKDMEDKQSFSRDYFLN